MNPVNRGVPRSAEFPSIRHTLCHLPFQPPLCVVFAVVRCNACDSYKSVDMSHCTSVSFDTDRDEHHSPHMPPVTIKIASYIYWGANVNVIVPDVGLTACVEFGWNLAARIEARARVIRRQQREMVAIHRERAILANQLRALQKEGPRSKAPSPEARVRQVCIRSGSSAVNCWWRPCTATGADS